MRRRRSGASLASRVGVGIFAGIVAGAPLAVGAVHRGFLIAIIAASGVALVFVAAGSVVDRRPIRVGLVFLLPAAFVVIPALQSVPLPLGLRGALDPAGNVFLTDEPALTPAAWPMSLDPTATRAILGKAAAALAVFLCAYHLASGQTRRHLMPKVVAGAGIAAVAIGFGHRLLGFTTIYGLFTTAQRGLLVGPFVNLNHNAEFLELGAFACLACAFQRPSKLHRYAWLAGMLACAVGAVATFSRAALFALLVGMGTFTLMRVIRRDASGTEGRRAPIGWALLFMGLVVVVILILGAGGLVERFRYESITSDTRVRLWRDAWNVVRAHPLGIGRGAFDRVFPIYRTIVVPFPVRFAFVENHPYQLLIDAGWIGVGLVVAGVALVVRTVVRSGRRDTIEAALLGGLLAVAAHSITDFGLETLGVALPFCAMLGTVLGRGHDAAESAPWRFRAAAAAAMAGIVLGSGSLALASSDNFDGLLKKAKSVDESRALLRRARQAHPTDYYYLLREASLEPLRPARGGPSPRLHALNLALLRCPGCDDVHVAVARSLWHLGSRGQAITEWRRAVELDTGTYNAVLEELYRDGATPEEMAAVASNDVESMLTVASFFSSHSRVKEALAVLDQTDAAFPRSAGTLIMRARLELLAGRVLEAQTALAELRAAGIIDSRVPILEARIGLAARGERGADEALATLDAAAARYPLDVDVQRARLELVRQFGRWQVADRAVEGLKVALYHSQGEASEAYIASAQIHASLGQWTQSFGDYRAALISRPNSRDLWLEYGRAAERAGRYPVAREAYAEATRVSPDDPEATAGLRRVDESMSEARRRSAIEGSPTVESTKATEAP